MIALVFSSKLNFGKCHWKQWSKWMLVSFGLLLSPCSALAGGSEVHPYPDWSDQGPTRMNGLLQRSGVPKVFHPVVRDTFRARGVVGSWVFTTNGPSAGLAAGVSRGCIPLDAYTDAGDWDLQMLARHRYKMYFTSIGPQIGGFIQKFWFLPFAQYSVYDMDRGLRAFGVEVIGTYKIGVGKVALTSGGLLITGGLGLAVGGNINTLRIQQRGTGSPCFR